MILTLSLFHTRVSVINPFSEVWTDQALLSEGSHHRKWQRWASLRGLRSLVMEESQASLDASPV